MTPKQEREWAQGIMERIKDDRWGVEVCAMGEFLGIVKGLAKSDKYIDKAYARRIAGTFENVLWLREYQKGEITKEEFWKRLEDKGRAEAEKKIDAFNKRLDRELHPRRKKRKKRTTAGR
jgi:hypothetical protein